jgi:hypothetical protein
VQPSRIKPGDICHIKTSGEKVFILDIRTVTETWKVGDRIVRPSQQMSGLEAVVRLPRGERHTIAIFLVEELETRDEFRRRWQERVQEVLANAHTVNLNVEKEEGDDQIFFIPDDDDPKKKPN